MYTDDQVPIGRNIERFRTEYLTTFVAFRGLLASRSASCEACHLLDLCVSSCINTSIESLPDVQRHMLQKSLHGLFHAFHNQLIALSIDPTKGNVSSQQKEPEAQAEGCRG